MKTLNAAHSLVRQLHNLGIRHVFGFPGESTLPLAVAAHNIASPCHHLAGCERCAGYMADGCARFGDRVTVAYAPGGIGSPHMLPAMSEAYNSSIPIVFISISEPLAQRGRWSTSTFDHRAFDHVCKANIPIHHGSRMADSVRDAIRIAASPRTGPTHLEIPYDILTSEISAPSYEEDPCESLYPRFRLHASPDCLIRVRDRILRAEQPVAVLGGGAQLSRVPADLIGEFARRCELSLVATLNGKGTYPESEPASRYLGVAGQKGEVAANRAVRESDLVILLGTKMGDKSSLDWTLIRNSQDVVQVDVDPAEIGRNFRVVESVLSDIRAFLEDILATLGDAAIPCRKVAVVAESSGSADTPPLASVMQHLSSRLTSEDMLIADASQACGWMGSYFRSSLSGRGTASPRGTGSIGFALPAALGAWCARPQARVAAIGGDGGLLLCMHEMEACVRLRASLKFFLINNNALGLLDHHLEHLHGVRGVLDQRAPVQWSHVCHAFGWKYLGLSSADDLGDVIDRSFALAGPTLIDMRFEDTMPPDFRNTVNIRK